MGAAWQALALLISSHMSPTLTLKKRTIQPQGPRHHYGFRRSSMEHTVVSVLAGFLLAGGVATSAIKSEPDTPLMSVSGTIMRIDQAALRMSVHDDTGRQRHFAVANVDAMAYVRAGDHVCVEVDQGGIVLNIQRTTPVPQRPTLSYASG
jgi:hypothetical protein